MPGHRRSSVPCAVSRISAPWNPSAPLGLSSHLAGARRSTSARNCWRAFRRRLGATPACAPLASKPAQPCLVKTACVEFANRCCSGANRGQAWPVRVARACLPPTHCKDPLEVATYHRQIGALHPLLPPPLYQAHCPNCPENRKSQD